ncbi:MAG: hypothetical protein CL920_21330 [Deltaproteobacteria bacterium]|nr:hypothetical protein [Deltaproteobacteria bacterium]MBU51239.1 hypothetical protein [Deltaproteobacteria bacterium]
MVSKPNEQKWLANPIPKAVCLVSRTPLYTPLSLPLPVFEKSSSYSVLSFALVQVVAKLRGDL